MPDSQATRAVGVWVRHQSSTASEIWSQILSGRPSVTDSEVNRRLGALMKVLALVDAVSAIVGRPSSGVLTSFSESLTVPEDPSRPSNHTGPQVPCSQEDR